MCVTNPVGPAVGRVSQEVLRLRAYEHDQSAGELANGNVYSAPTPHRFFGLSARSLDFHARWRVAPLLHLIG